MTPRIEPNDPIDPSRVEHGFDLHGAISFAWRQWKFIAAVTIAVFLIGTAYLLQQTPLYTATSQVLLDRPREKAPAGGAIVNDLDLNRAMLEGQIAVIQSTVLLRRVVEREHLAAEPTAVDDSPTNDSFGSPSFLSSLSSLYASLLSLVTTPQPDEAKLPAKRPPPPAGPEARATAEMDAVEALQGSLKVKPVAREGYVIAISVTSPDPGRAARLANAVANAYLVDKLDTRFEAAKRASAWLSDRLVGLRKQLHASEEAVQQFRSKHGLIASGGVTLTEQQLSKLNASLIDAKADLAQKRAQVELLDSIRANRGSLQNMPGIANASALQSLQTEASTLSAQEAKLLARYGSAHPLVVNIRAQLRDIDRSIATETARLAAGIRNDYQLAQARVASLEDSLKRATGQTDLDNATAVRLRELERTAAVNKVLFETFLKQAKITQAQSTFQPEDVRIITPATTPTGPSYPRTTRFMAINLFFGLLFGVGGAVAKEKLKTGFVTPNQIEDLLGLPLLASISRLNARDLSVDRAQVPITEQPVAKPLSRFSEAIRSLRIGIQMTDVDHPPKVIQVTSAVPGEGKTTVAMALAASAAFSKLKVLLIDADLRHPAATRVFGLQKEAGLVDLLLGNAPVESVIRPYEKGGYWGLGAGAKTQNPSDLLGSERMKGLVAGLKELYDLIVIDTPPMGPVMDPLVVSHLTDKAVLVVRWGATSRELVKTSIAQLSGHRKIAGVVLNQVIDRRAKKYGRHAHHYHYGNRYYKNYYEG
jgi:succinoglycan biosynthesis transport protein ExoP